MYLIAITLCLCIGYFVLMQAFRLFFQGKIENVSKGDQRSVSLPSTSASTGISIAIIVILSFIGYYIAFSIPDFEWSNRFLHAFGGGFMAFLVCYLAARNSGVPMNKFQFFVLSALTVIALGVANEIMEFIMQNYAGMNFTTTINDTWLDLISNTIGLLVAAIILTPCFGARNQN